ncbi:hypothetical protein [Cryobacterium roopkundense]|uniref:Uncharacterized protein n=1 Tax=Cryobacterium roopkundense TaxID=1001240 RepID=A0A7W8ZTE0_9MICO|nr:hypothetical protein [Cryobacterium roopkundense]MBB5639836.1 hypothetical protein [Cryobacterium roopkundense]
MDNFTRLADVLYIDRMRIPLRGTLLGTLALASLCLLGCASAPPPQVTPSPPETPAAPVFASNDEALEAATAAYGAYVAMSTTLLAEGGADAQRISGFVSAEYLPDVLKSFEGMLDTGHTSSGTETFDTVSLIRYADEKGDVAAVSIYLCDDVSQTKVVDRAGIDVTPKTRLARVPFQIALVSSPSDPRVLLIDEEDVWPGQNFC